MRNSPTKGFALAAAVFLVSIALSALTNAGSLRGDSTGGDGAASSLPGQVQWGYYETTEVAALCAGSDPSEGCDQGGNGDSILRLIDPNGSANPALGGSDQPVCAMIYVFDDDQEMGECCGCPLTSAQLATFSVDKNLTSNWGLGEAPERTTARARSPSSPELQISPLPGVRQGIPMGRAVRSPRARLVTLVATRPTFPVTRLPAPTTCSAASRTMRSFKPDRWAVRGRSLESRKSRWPMTARATRPTWRICKGNVVSWSEMAVAAAFAIAARYWLRLALTLDRLLFRL